MKRRTLEFVALTAICCQVLSCAAKQTTITSQKQPNWSEAAPEAITAAQPEEEKKINAQTYFAAGRLYEQQKVYHQAILQYRQVLALEPDNVAALNRVGMIYARIGRHNEAESMLLRAVELQPDSALLRNNIGFVYVAQKRWADAEAEFHNAIRLKPSFHRAHINLGMVLSKLDRYDDALRAFLEVLPEADAYYNLGLMLRAKHRHREAAEAFQLALDINPGFSAAQTQLAQLQPRLRLIESLEPKSNDANWQALSGRERESHPAAPAVVAEQPVETMLPAIEAEPVPIETELTAADRDEIAEPDPVREIEQAAVPQAELVEETEPVAISEQEPEPVAETQANPIQESEPTQAAEATPEPETIETLAINEAEPQPEPVATAIAEDDSNIEADAETEQANAIAEPAPIATEVVVVEEIIQEPAIEEEASEPTEMVAADEPAMIEDAAPIADEAIEEQRIEPVARQEVAEEIETLPVREIVETREIARSDDTSIADEPTAAEPIAEATMIEEEPIAEAPATIEEPIAKAESIEDQAEQIPAEMIMLVDLGDEDDITPAVDDQPVGESKVIAASAPAAEEAAADEQIEVIQIPTEESNAQVASAEQATPDAEIAIAPDEQEEIESLPVDPIEKDAIADTSPTLSVLPALLSGQMTEKTRRPIQAKRDTMFLTVDDSVKAPRKATERPLKVKTRTNAKKGEVIEAELISVTSEPEVIAVDAEDNKKSDD